jgi:hypothetical protein
VAGEVRQDVDAVGADLGGQLGIAQGGDPVPGGDEAAQAGARPVLPGQVAVGHQAQPALAEGFKHGLHEVGHRVLAQVAGHKADAQRALGVAVVGVARCRRAQAGVEGLPKRQCSAKMVSAEAPGSCIR